MCPFPATEVIPEGWAAHHRPTVHGSMTATCTITTGGAGGWTPGGGPAPSAATTLYSGPCRAQALNSGANAVDAAGQVTVERPYLVAVDAAAADIPVGARVTIATCPDDAHLVGKTLTVADPKYGSLRFERDLLCDLDLSNQEG